MENQIKPKHVQIIINAGSGAGSDDETIQKIKELFAAHHFEAEFSLAHGGEELLAFAELSAKNEFDLIVAAGGDGTVSAVAARLVGTDKILGVLPLGTLNHFSKDLNIPADLAAAVDVIAADYSILVDVASVNERIFINNSSIGLYPRIVRRRENQQNRLGRSKWFAAFWATLAVVRRHSQFAVKIKTDGEAETLRTPFLFVGNNEYEMEFFNIGARTCLDSGKLSVYLLRGTNRLGLVRLAARTLFGRLRQAKDFEAFCATEITIETQRRKKQILTATDGEVGMIETPLCYKILPKSLRVIVPRAAEKV